MATHFDKNTLIMDFPEYKEAVNHVWFRIEFPVNTVNYHHAKFESKFDLSLSRISEDEDIHEWSLIDLVGTHSIDKLIMGIFKPHSRNNQLINFHGNWYVAIFSNKVKNRTK